MSGLGALTTGRRPAAATHLSRGQHLGWGWVKGLVIRALCKLCGGVATASRGVNRKNVFSPAMKLSCFSGQTCDRLRDSCLVFCSPVP